MYLGIGPEDPQQAISATNIQVMLDVRPGTKKYAEEWKVRYFEIPAEAEKPLLHLWGLLEGEPHEIWHAIEAVAKIAYFAGNMPGNAGEGSTN